MDIWLKLQFKVINLIFFDGGDTQKTYPVLSAIARDLLMPPVSTVHQNQLLVQMDVYWTEKLSLHSSAIEAFVYERLGNNGLCGKPLKACSSSKKKTILIIVVIVAVVVALAAIVGISYRRSKRSKTPNELKKNQETRALQKYGAYDMGQKEKEVPYSADQLGGENGKLFFVRNDRERFELQDLLRASAEVLGSGSFGSSYKAVLLSGPAMVVKRFRQMSSVGKEDFHNHMRRLGSLSHPNLLPLVAFYYRKEEKLLVSDFVSNGSLASHLHGKRSPGQPGLDWPTRLKIIKGVAKGLAYLYREFPSVPLPHGHLKSSNVLLDHTFEPILTDYALVPVMNKEHAQLYMVAYKSPEFNQSDRITRKTDVWSLGILILELLTGKFPANYLKQGKGGNADLATWVNSVVREEWTGEVFDKDMKGTRNGEGEMLKLLKIGMCCCEWNAERRWDFREAMEKIQELKERDSNTDIEDSSSYNSEDYGYSSRPLTDDDFSFSVNG
ncbi:probable LRR receptor-like serine/threonine-protein kinase At4g31250 [Pistacia vera]|uniref:probable LRR receptor-like serine/threonine-protein kinase At4g31250 n=1 Tax=Pistacia vera TaxID=55513 RepID=UPI001262D4AE|nr:probable LRR receptor-like serine/threonine-protein kinase At4g31250 [Pistacia vera]